MESLKKFVNAGQTAFDPDDDTISPELKAAMTENQKLQYQIRHLESVSNTSFGYYAKDMLIFIFCIIYYSRTCL